MGCGYDDDKSANIGHSQVHTRTHIVTQSLKNTVAHHTRTEVEAAGPFCTQRCTVSTAALTARRSKMRTLPSKVDATTTPWAEYSFTVNTVDTVSGQAVPSTSTGAAIGGTISTTSTTNDDNGSHVLQPTSQHHKEYTLCACEHPNTERGKSKKVSGQI